MPVDMQSEKNMKNSMHDEKSFRKNAARILAAAAVCFISLSCLSCAATMSRTLPPAARSIALEKFEVPVELAWVGPEFDSILRQQVVREGRLSPAEASKADLVLSGIITKTVIQPETRDASGRVISSRVYMIATVKLKLASGAEIWNETFESVGIFQGAPPGWPEASPDRSETRMDGLTEAASKMAAKIVERIVRGWRR